MSIASVSGLICVIMTTVAFVLHPPNLKTNTDEAFKTWGTCISGALNTYNSLANQLTQNLPWLEHRRPDPVQNEINTTSERKENQEKHTCTDLITVVFKAPNIQDLEKGQAMKDLCMAHNILTQLLNNSWAECSGKVVQPISYFSAVYCHRSVNAECENIDKAKDDPLENIPILGGGAFVSIACTGAIEKILKQIFGFNATIESALLSSEALMTKGRPVYTAVHLPTSNASKLSEMAYKILMAEGKLFKVLRFQGIFVDDDTRTKLLEEAIKKDLISLVPICAFLVVLLMWLYCDSCLYTITALGTLLFAFGISYFIYYFIYRMEPFWFTNYLSAVILLGIGADDCFVLFHSLKGEHRSTRSIKSNGKAAQQQQQKSDPNVRAFAQASLAMFVTSITTAIAFLTNMMTDVIAIKAFGIFAATLVMINYLLVISYLPASLMVNDHYWEPIVAKKLISCSSGCLRDFFQKVSDKAFNEILPLIIDRCKYPLVLFMIAVSVGSGIMTFHHPKLPFAQNSSQLFHKDHPIQWFLDNFVNEFDINQPPVTETIHAIWGMHPVDTSNKYHRNWPSDVELDMYFGIDDKFISNQQKLCEILRNNGFHGDCFALRFQKFYANNCPEERNVENIKNCLIRYIKEKEKPINSTTTVRNGPLFDRTTLEIQGYVQNFETKFPASVGDCRFVNDLRYKVNSTFTKAAALLNYTQLSRGWIVPGSNIASKILYKCDLKQVLQESTFASVAVALSIALFVVILVTRNIKLGLASICVICTIILCTTACLVVLQWELNIVESIIITLGVGLSFDFTLHYAVAYREHGAQCPSSKGKIAAMLDEAGVPVFLSAMSTLTAGLIFSFSEAYPFFQVGVFMVLITVCSWTGSTFVFTAFIVTVDKVLSSCSSENLELSYSHAEAGEKNLDRLEIMDAQLQGLLQ